ncbi:MAG TPA: DHA2 family efflux MFS transporter permease subunit [Pseudonocardiaceae bacterium]
MTATVAAAEPRRGAPDPAPDPAPGVYTHRQIMTILGALMLGMLLAALDQTIVSTAIRTIADDLNGLSLQAWATTAYLIAATISTPLYGKLSDLYGRKPFFLTAISIFIVGSVLCTISTSMYELAAFRAVQGLGAGGLMSLALAILGDIVPPRQRARYQGYFLAVFGTSSVIGPLVGGAFAGAHELAGIAGWRWVFLVNVPIAAAALVVVAKVLNIPHTRREHRIDWPGAIALCVAVVPVLLVAEQGQLWGWDSPRSVTCYVLAAVGLGAFVMAERVIGDDALLPLRLFRNSVFSVSSAAGLIIGMGMFGGIVLLPQYLQIVKGASPTKAGLLLLPLMAGVMVGSVLSGQLTSRSGRYKIFPLIGTALMTTALLALHFRLGVDSPLCEVDVYLVIFGLGLGNCMQTLVIAVQNAVPARDMGSATASSTFFRQMGGTMGVAVFLSILFSTVGARIADAFRDIAVTPGFRAALVDPAVLANPDNSIVLRAIRSGGLGGDAGGVLQDSSFLQRIDPRLARPFLVGFSGAMDVVFLCAAGVTALGFLLILFLKEVPLRTQSGIEARAAELAAEATAASRSVSAPVPEAAPMLPSLTASTDWVGSPARPPIESAMRRPMTTPELPEMPARPALLPSYAGSPAVGSGRGTEPSAAVWRRRDPAPGSGDGTGPTEPGQPEIARPAVSDPVGSEPRGAESQAPATTSGDTRGFRTEPWTAQPAPPAAAGGHSGSERGPVIFGQVNEAGSTPLPGATLTLTTLSGRQLDRGTSDSAGRYRLRPPSGGSYLVICASAAHQPTAALVAVADVPVRHDITLSGTGSSLSGVVYAAGSGQPIEDAVVTLIDIQGDVVGATPTGREGRFTFMELGQGLYTLTVAAATLQPVAHTVEVPANGHVTHDVEVAARVQLVGTVRTASAGLPVPEALTTLVGSDGNVVGSVITDIDGGFVFDDLAAGAYTIIATGYPPVAAEVQVGSAVPTEAVITLRPPTISDPASGNGADRRSADRGGDDHGSY